MKLKSIIASLTVICFTWLNVGSAYGAAAVPVFRDIRGSFAEKAVARLADQGMIRGINAEKFAPENNISRLHFAVLLAKTLGVQPFFPSGSAFSDLPAGTMETGYVEALANLGLIKGQGNKIFGGSTPIRRQDVAVILQKALGDKTAVTSLPKKYTDAGQISSYAIDSVAWMVDNGWMVGSGSRFYPLRNLTRGEAAVLADRLLKLRTDQALQALKQPAGSLELESGKTGESETGVTASPVAYSVVYGLDNPGLCSVSPESTLLSGKQPGTGIVTVNAGSQSYPVSVNVRNPGSGEEIAEGSGASAFRGSEKEIKVTTEVLIQSPDTSFQKTEYKNYSGPVDGLTSKSDAWTGYFRQRGRDIIIDMGTLNTVSDISMEFKQDTGSGIYLPDYIKGSVSVDGISWYQLGKVYHGISLSDPKVQNVTLSLSLPPVTARYIKLSFPVNIFVFARHLSVKGEVAAVKPVILAPDVQEKPAAGTYLQNQDIKDILLIFTGDKTDQKTLTSDDFLPLVSYMSPEGEIRNRMFDTLLFMPYTGMPCTKDSWNSYLADLFTPGQQLHALDDAMQDVNATFGLQQKEKVILTLPYPDANQSQFGSLEQNEEALSFSEKAEGGEQAVQNRSRAVQWYYDKLMDQWNSAGFGNLDLAGIYWYKESVDKTVYHEKELVQNTAQMVRDNGQRFIWIPFFSASGFEDWKSYGFTDAFLQPNYYATQDPPEDRMDRAAALAKQYGAGIELEFDNRILTTRYYYDLFYNELRKAHELGLEGDTPNAYYMGLAQTLLDTVHSDVPQIRKIYDDMYRWINGIYI